MPIFFRGAGVGTWWHIHDPKVNGFTPHQPKKRFTIDRLIRHIAYSTTASPFVSLTRSYGVALTYALEAGKQRPSYTKPAFVYEIEIDDSVPSCKLIDPIKEIAEKAILDPASPTPSYQHNGYPEFLLSVIDPLRMGTYANGPAPTPPTSPTAYHPITETDHLRAMVRTLRDAEVLAFGAIPPSCILHCHKVVKRN